jgi:hypothetical protein
VRDSTQKEPLTRQDAGSSDGKELKPYPALTSPPKEANPDNFTLAAWQPPPTANVKAASVGVKTTALSDFTVSHASCGKGGVGLYIVGLQGNISSEARNKSATERITTKVS